jgi:hypothetical protein
MDYQAAMHVYQELAIIIKNNGFSYNGPNGLRCLDRIGGLYF